MSNTDTTLNEKILKIFSDNTITDYAGDDGDVLFYDTVDETSAANSIEQLIIQEKIDLLNERFFSNSWEPDQGEMFKNKISELEAQLKELNTQ